MTGPLKIGIAGLGTVGAGVVKLLAEHNELLSLRGGRRLELVAVSARYHRPRSAASTSTACAGTRIRWRWRTTPTSTSSSS